MVKKFLLLSWAICLPMLSGCTLSDAMFGILNESYSEGGNSYVEKKQHYDQQVEAWENYQAP